MQNAPAMLAQKMMNRQAAYAPVGMVSQNMSGNKKGGGDSGPPVGSIGLSFDTTTSTAGLTFSNSNTTATNPSGSTIKSAKTFYPKTTGKWYAEFYVNSLTFLVGIGPSTFVCDTTNRVGYVSASIGLGLFGSVVSSGTTVFSSTSPAVGDVIGVAYDLTGASVFVTFYLNNVLYYSNTIAAMPSGSYVPIFSSNAIGGAVTVSNNIYSPPSGYLPLNYATTVIASASVPAVADGKYDVYTFNASGTFTAGSTGAVRALVIAGGGGGGNTGGGGAGGYLENGATVTPQTYTVTVGGGGTFFGSGASSSFGTLISTVGGGGGNSTAGGSGSGGSPSIPGPNTVAGGAGTTGQGFAGGQGNSVSATLYGGGGGGGAGSVGGAGNAGSNGLGGNGGTGKTSNINGTSVGRGGGGSAAGYLGNGTFSDGGKDASGTSNTGGGGGWNSGAGGSGVVIIRVRARA